MAESANPTLSAVTVRDPNKQLILALKNDGKGGAEEIRNEPAGDLMTRQIALTLIEQL